MKFPPASAVTLVRLLRRDGFAFFGKCARYAFSRDAWLWLLRGGSSTDNGFAPCSELPKKSAGVPASTTIVSGPVPDLPPDERERSRRVLGGYEPKISVVVASYNYAHLIGETLDALEAQTYGNFEVLVIDNASSDNSVEVIKKYVDRDPRFKLTVHEKNLGLPGSVKHGVELATGEFVAFCEADDLWTTDHLEKKVELLREHWGKPNFVVNDIELIGDPERCKTVAEWLVSSGSALAGVRNRIAPVDFRNRNWVNTFSICMVRRSVLLGCDMASVPRPSNLDWWLWRQICFDNDIWVVHEKLTKWRLHKDSYLMRDVRTDPAADRDELTSRMDAFLCERHPALADSLVPFLRPEDRFDCREGTLSMRGTPTAQPSFSVVIVESGQAQRDEATIDSLAGQIYGNFELVLVSKEISQDVPAGPALPFATEGRLAGRVRKTVVPGDVTEAVALETGIAAATSDWIVPVWSGDILRPDALKTFAARIVLRPDIHGVFGIARTRIGGRNFGGPRVVAAPGMPAGPFVCVGAFAFRRSGAGVRMFADSRFSNAEAVFAARMLASPPTDFASHIVLFRDDGADGRDPGAQNLLAAMFECLKARNAPRRAPTASEIATVRHSPFFDETWYVREWPGIVDRGKHPAFHYLSYGSQSHDCNPSPDFIGDEYLSLNQDVRDHGVNPLVHFEIHGRKENRMTSFLQLRSSAYPDGAIEREREFSAAPLRHRRVAVFAAHSGTARIPESTLLYLRGLREVVDDIVFVSSNPVLPGETEKLDGLVRFALFRDHCGYDFFSYRLGWEKAGELGLLAPAVCDELLVCNDSCYAPVLPFMRCFSVMEKRRCDFWGMTANSSFVGTEHIQSFFFVFRRPVLDDGSLARFLGSVEPISDRWEVIRRYEAGLTAALVAEGHSWDTLVPKSFASENGCTPTKRPLALMSRFDMPLLKISAMKGDMKEDRNEVLSFVRAHHPELAAVIPAKATPTDYDLPRRLREAHPRSFAAKIEAIRRERIGKGLPVRALFLVFSPSMFPARPLLDAMLRDAAFDARILVVPDLRWRDQNPEDLRTSCRKDLGSFYPADRFLDANEDASGEWPDVIGDFGADIVCYPSPYDLSAFRYNPHWAVGRRFLPVYISYSFSTSLHGYEVYGRQNYAYFWKVFTECEANAKEYAEHSILKGANAETVGYFKMDALASAKPWPHVGNRKRVLIAPHHSVEGGANDSLSLSNFQRYADYFLALPEKHPELDFVFRPHPFLFTVLARPNKWGREKADGWIARMKAHPNVRWSDEGDYFPAFASCDAMVQDCGSYLAEWVYTGKPCCFMLKAPSDIGAKFTSLGRDILSHYYLAYDEAAIESFLRDVVEGGSDPKAAARDEFRKAVMVNYPHAADAALAAIKRELGMA